MMGAISAPASPPPPPPVLGYKQKTARAGSHPMTSAAAWGGADGTTHAQFGGGLGLRLRIWFWFWGVFVCGCSFGFSVSVSIFARGL